MRLKKKAALELSINAIVIVVLAMTLLGLGLGFVRNMIGGITETTGSVQEQIKQQILDDLRRGDKKLSFPSTEISVESNGQEVMAIGVKNTGDTDLTFTTDIFDLTDDTLRTKTDALDPKSSNEQQVGNFFWDNGDQILKAGEANVYSIKYFAPQKSGTYMYKIVIVGNSTIEYTSKTFFVNVR